MDNTITCCDCIDGMQKISSNSIEMVCTEPPHFSNNESFYNFYLKVSTEVFRILKPGCMFISFGAVETAVSDAGFITRDRGPICFGMKPPGQIDYVHQLFLSNNPQTIQLTCNLIRLFTNENATVVDPFMGCGITALACIQMNRKYIGFDIDSTHLHAAFKQITSFNK